MKPSEQLRELAEKWRREAIEHNRCAPEMVQPRNFLRECAFDLESFVPAVEQLEQAQRERDTEIRKRCSYLSVFEKDERCILREGHEGLHVMEKIAE